MMGSAESTKLVPQIFIKTHELSMNRADVEVDKGSCYVCKRKIACCGEKTRGCPAMAAWLCFFLLLVCTSLIEHYVTPYARNLLSLVLLLVLVWVGLVALVFPTMCKCRKHGESSNAYQEKMIPESTYEVLSDNKVKPAEIVKNEKIQKGDPSEGNLLIKDENSTNEQIEESTQLRIHYYDTLIYS